MRTLLLLLLLLLIIIIIIIIIKYEGWNFDSGNYLFTNDTK